MFMTAAICEQRRLGRKAFHGTGHLREACVLACDRRNRHATSSFTKARASSKAMGFGQGRGGGLRSGFLAWHRFSLRSGMEATRVAVACGRKDDGPAAGYAVSVNNVYSDTASFEQDYRRERRWPRQRSGRSTTATKASRPARRISVGVHKIRFGDLEVAASNFRIRRAAERKLPCRFVLACR